jgi:phage gpG-like protein
MNAGLLEFQLDKNSADILIALSKHKLFTKKGFEKVGDSYRKHMRGIFSGSTKRDADLAWPKLNPLTVAFKRKRFGTTKTLIATGALRNSITKKGASGNITRIKNDSAEYGTNIFYAKFHFTGLPNRVVKSQKQKFFLARNIGLFKNVGDKIPLPKRDPVTPNQAAISSFGSIVQKEIIDRIQNLGVNVK